jgi:[protein-PII] uridylyltransferase
MPDLIPLELRHWELAKEQFFSTGDGLSSVASRTGDVDQIVDEGFAECFPDAERDGVAALAVGGYGRSQLFPHSDVDLLLLFNDNRLIKGSEDALARLLAQLWDAKLRLSHSVRTPKECTTIAPENAELNISLLDSRFLSGDQALYQQLREVQLPRFYLREQGALLRNLVELSQARHQRQGKTIYHLEPDIKECPGGLRDFQLACWISQLVHVNQEELSLSERHLPDREDAEWPEAKRFLFAVRCYLHYFVGRDNNKLTFELQDRVSQAGSERAFRKVDRTEDWMRDYFRHVRALARLATRMMEEAAVSRRSLLSRVQDRSSRLSHADFPVSRGRIYLRHSQALKTQPELVFELFRWVSRHGLPLARETERRIADALPGIEAYARSKAPVWPVFAEILKLPYAYRMLTAMHETGVLFALFPEFELVDCLVIRDFYHRYTVDEHLFRAVRHIHELESDEDEQLRGYGSLLAELADPEYCYFAVLFHDVGKGIPGPDHSQRSIELTDRAMERLGMDDRGRETVRFLIRHHLTMSAFMRGRDVSDPDTIQELADILGTTDRLRALTLVTFADIRAVNPTAMTPWRRELLWQLFVATYNRLTGDVEDSRIHPGASETYLEPPASADERKDVEAFLDGFPERYVRTRTPEKLRSHFDLSRKLKDQDSAVSVTGQGSFYEVVVITKDRPHLFASLCGGLAAFGVSIEKAEAFANAQDLVLDTFVVVDSNHRLDSSQDEPLQLSRMLRKVAEERLDVRELLRAREPAFRRPTRTWIKPRISVDNQTSQLATVIHVTAQDRVGLLYDLSRTLSERHYDIEVVIIETHGRKAMDVFYVTGPDGKLAPMEGERLRDDMLAACDQNLHEKAG